MLVLGSDVFEYPYYLKSVEQILEGGGFKTSIREMYEWNETDPQGPALCLRQKRQIRPWHFNCEGCLK